MPVQNISAVRLQNAYTNTVALSTKVSIKRLTSMCAWHEARITQLVWWGRHGRDSRGIRVQFPIKYKNFSLLQCIQTHPAAHPASIQWALEALALGVKRVGHEADHQPLSSSKFKNQWSYTSMPHMLLWIACAQLHLTFILVNVQEEAVNIQKCMVLVTSSSTVHICNSVPGRKHSSCGCCTTCCMHTCPPPPHPSKQHGLLTTLLQRVLLRSNITWACDTKRTSGVQ
jgi:hypothetical protein